MLEVRWVKCMEQKEVYIEKYIDTFSKVFCFYCRLNIYQTSSFKVIEIHTI